MWHAAFFLYVLSGISLTSTNVEKDQGNVSLPFSAFTVYLKLFYVVNIAHWQNSEILKSQIYELKNKTYIISHLQLSCFFFFCFFFLH